LHETAQLHRTPGRGHPMAVRGARAAGRTGAAHRRADEPYSRRRSRSGAHWGIPLATTATGLGREGGTQMKKIVRLVALCAALIVSGSAFAQQYPSKPVRVVVPFPPGGVTDIAGRLIAQKLSERLGHQFYIENISGAGGNIGMANAARSPGDGYTILLASSSIV